MFLEQIVFLIALAFFAGSIIRLVSKKIFYAPQLIAAITFLLMGVFALFPQMKYNVNREYILGMKTQIFLLLAAISYYATCHFMRKPYLRESYPPVRWRLLPRKAWLLIFLGVCISDPVVSYLLYGKIGLIQGNEGMGSGGGNQSEVFTPITFIAWSCASMAMTMVMTDFLFSFNDILPYLKKRFPEILIVMGCSFCTALSGNRFVLICQLISLILGLGLFSKLKVWMLATVVTFLGVFFVIVGNFRFGTVNIVDSLQSVSGIGAYDMLKAWVVTYTEPTFPNLNNFLNDQPAMSWGLGWITTVIPSGIIDSLGLSRTNSAQWFAENNLYAYSGLTFRTLYPDLIMDFGYKGCLILSTVFLAGGVWIYNRLFKSPFHFVLFMAYSPLILLMPLLASFYSLPNLTAFAIVFLIQRPKKRKRLASGEPTILQAAHMATVSTGR